MPHISNTHTTKTHTIPGLCQHRHHQLRSCVAGVPPGCPPASSDTHKPTNKHTFAHDSQIGFCQHSNYQLRACVAGVPPRRPARARDAAARRNRPNKMRGRRRCAVGCGPRRPPSAPYLGRRGDGDCAGRRRRRCCGCASTVVHAPCTPLCGGVGGGCLRQSTLHFAGASFLMCVLSLCPFIFSPQHSFYP